MDNVQQSIKDPTIDIVQAPATSPYTICVVGLGYVGMPLAYNFASNGLPVYGFDISQEKITHLQNGYDPSHEVTKEQLGSVDITYSADAAIIAEANFIIVAVPTPIDGNNQPDLRPVEAATKTIAQYLSPGSIVVFESTVYPGVTEEVCLPILEQVSGLRGGEDFFVGYSPERVNPGDEEHTIDKIIKVVSGQTSEVCDIIANVYSIPCKAGVHKASSIKVAESAKVIENIQRDLNIALFNELSLIFNRLGIDTHDVIEAAGTKWNFHKYHPGLVGGHCIGVDPYYLVHKALQVGHEPRIITAGRAINNAMPGHIAQEVIKMLIQAHKKVKGARVLVMGLTFKENVNDVRNSKVGDIIKVLHEYEIEVYGHEPHVDDDVVTSVFGVSATELPPKEPVDAVIVCNRHKQFEALSFDELCGMMRDVQVVFDVKGMYRSAQKGSGVVYKSL